MKNKFRSMIFLAAICILVLLPQKALAADMEYNFNKNKSISIAESDSYEASGKYTWLKYKAGSDGYLTVKMSNPENAVSSAKGYIALYNGRKTTPLSSKSIFYNTEYGNRAYWQEISFGLQKGEEYYIRVMAENAVKLSRTFTKVKVKSGKTKAKAVTLKQNKAKKGLMFAGTSSADWYRFQITKSRKLRLYYNAKTRGSFKLSVYFGKQMIMSRTIRNTEAQRKITLALEKSGKETGMVPGAYYIKIERADSASSGFYKIKWN